MWLKKRKNDLIKLKSELEGNLENLTANILPPSPPKRPSSSSGAPAPTSTPHASAPQLAPPSPLDTPTYDRTSRSSSAPSLERDSSMASVKSAGSLNKSGSGNNVDMGQWETFSIRNPGQPVEETRTAGRFPGLTDCLIDDALLFNDKGAVGNKRPMNEIGEAMRNVGATNTELQTPSRITKGNLEGLPSNSEGQWTRNNQSPSVEVRLPTVRKKIDYFIDSPPFVLFAPPRSHWTTLLTTPRPRLTPTVTSRATRSPSPSSSPSHGMRRRPG